MNDLALKIKSMMSKYRYEHTLSTAEECRRLAKLFGIDDKKLVNAAYLHDITKEKSIEEQIIMCKKAGVCVPNEELLSPKTLHSFSAYAVISDIFPEYSENEILNAVRYHTTGRANMSLHEKLLYLADYIEPTRKFDDCRAMREYFYDGKDELNTRLDDTILKVLKMTVKKLTDQNLYIHPQTINAYNFLIVNKEKDHEPK